jgi:predicted nucleotidyltransferase
MTIRNLLQSLADHKVKFVVIGGLAFPAYGYIRNTYDIDIFFEPTKVNVKRLKKALIDFGYLGLEEYAVDQLLKKKTLFRQYLLSTDIHPFVAGAEFKTVWKNKREVEIENVKVFVPSLDNLIEMKKAAGRTKDLADLEFLREIKRQTTKKKK